MMNKSENTGAGKFIKGALIASLIFNVLAFYQSYKLWTKVSALSWKLQNCEKASK